MTLLGGRHRPVRRRASTSSTPDAALDPAPRRRPALRRRPAGALPSASGRRRRPDRRQRAAAARARGATSSPPPASRSCSPARPTLAVCLDKWALAERCHGHVRVPRDRRRRRRASTRRASPLPVIVKPRSGSGSRGIRLRRARAPSSRRWSATGRCSSRSTCPAPEYSLDVLARADGHVAAVVPRERLKVDSGIAVTGRTLHDDALETLRARGRAADRADHRRQRPGQGRRGRRARAAGGQRPLPGHDAADRSPPASTCRGWRSARRSGTPIPDGPLPFEDIAMVRYFQERFFAFDDIADLQRHAAEIVA